MRVLTLLCVLGLTSGSLATPARAQVWVVDQAGGPGSDFTDIQSAIDAADHGHVILVEPGTYPGFDLELGLSVLGRAANQTDTIVAGQVTVRNIPTPHMAVLSGLRVTGQMWVLQSEGTVILDNLTWRGGGAPSGGSALTVQGSDDVLMFASKVEFAVAAAQGGNAVAVEGSRLEIVFSDLRGQPGSETTCGSTGGNGGQGLVAGASSDVRVYTSTVAGGDGGSGPDDCEWTSAFGGRGGHGFLMLRGSELVLAGGPEHLLRGGSQGLGSCEPFCGANDGAPGFPLSGEGQGARYSGVTIQGFMHPAAEEAIPADPYLRLFGTHQAGRTLTFWVHGPEGAQAYLHLGRDSTIVPGMPFDVLTDRQVSIFLGTLQVDGAIPFQLTLPPGTPIGQTLFARAEVVLDPQDRRRTHSVPIVVRHEP